MRTDMQPLPYHEYPIEQLARSRSTRFQLGFARMALHLMPDFKQVILEPTGDGLKILACNEPALAPPCEVLRQVYRHDIQIDMPAVRLLHGDPVLEPVMWVRASVDRAHAESVIHDLVNRGAEIEEVDWMTEMPVVRAKAPLRQLLGYAEDLLRIAGVTADLRMWLSHYADRPPDPGKAA